MGQAHSSITSVFHWITGNMARLSEWVLLAMTSIVFYDVVMRYLFNSPTIWALEISEFMLVFMTFIGLAEMQRQKANVNMGFFYAKFPLGMRRYIDVLVSLLVAIFSFLLLRASFDMALTAYKYGAESNSLLETPLVIPYSIVVVGMFFLLLQAIIDIVESVKRILISDQHKGGRLA